MNENNSYLIPANASRGKLILGFFRGIDLIVFGTGVGITLLLLMIFQNAMSDWKVAVAILAPALVTGFLVIPVPHQHNVMVFLENMYKYYFVNCNKYKWKGWCSGYGEESNEESGKQ